MRRLVDGTRISMKRSAGWVGVPLAALAMLVLVLSGSAGAHVSPPGCGQNGIDLNVSRTPATAEPRIANSILHDDAGDTDTANTSKTVTARVVDAGIAITNSATNEVGHQHVFDITVTALPGAVGPPTFNSITPSVTPAPTSQS